MLTSDIQAILMSQRHRLVPCLFISRSLYTDVRHPGYTRVSQRILQLNHAQRNSRMVNGRTQRTMKRRGGQTKCFQTALIVESSNIGNFIFRRRKCEGVAQPVGEHRSIRCLTQLVCNLEIEQRN